MALSVWLKAAALWLVILAFAILNGSLRIKLLVPVLGGAAGMLASGVLLSACILLVAWFAAPWYGRLRSRQWLAIGLVWLALTLVFEFSLGRLVQHKTWAELFDAYTFRAGNIWPIVLVVSAVSPWLTARLRGLLWAAPPGK